MKPYTHQIYGPTAVPYTIGVTSKNNLIDQKISVHKLRPGYHTTIHVVPKILDTSSDFNILDVEKRKCKLPNETDGFKLFKEYTQKRCEIECASRKASSFCRCLPWYYPNDFRFLPMCDMFGGFCFNQIMSNEVYYKSCKNQCLPDCKEMSLSIWQRTAPLNVLDLCRDQTYFHKFFEQNFQKIFAFERYRILIQKQQIPELPTAFSNGSLCVEYLSKYVSLVSVESPTENVAVSQLDKSLHFIDQLGIIGGNLGLCIGMSVLGMAEGVMILCIIITSGAQDLVTLTNKIVSILRSRKPEIEKEDSLEAVVSCNGSNIERNDENDVLEGEHEKIRKLYVSISKSICLQN